MRILVTGGAGFIGSHLVEALLERGDEVVIVDAFEPFYPEEIKRRNLTVPLERGASLVEADIRDAAAVQAVFRTHQPEKVVHLAARAGVRPSLEEAQLYIDINLTGTLNVLEAIRQHGNPDLVFGSSSSVYGLNEKIPFEETDPIPSPASPYGATKGGGELLCHTYSHLYGTNITALRFFTVYGPRQRPDMAIHKFAKLLADGRAIPLFGRGSVRDYTYVSDIVDGLMAAIDRARGYRIYNLGGGRTTDLDRMVELLAEALEVELKVDRRDPQPGDVPATFADIARARTELGYEPRFPFEAGIRRFAEWFRKSRRAA